MIRLATTRDDFGAFAALVTEYVEWFRARYQDVECMVDGVFAHQSLATEMSTLSAAYSVPNGKTFLAMRNGKVCGGGAYRRLSDGSCEMKRLFVSRRFGGLGTGRNLCNALIASAREDGYEMMRLDTGNRLTEAISLYESLGFQRCPAHHEYPAEIKPWLVFMQLSLLQPLSGV